MLAIIFPLNIPVPLEMSSACGSLSWQNAADITDLAQIWLVQIIACMCIRCGFDWMTKISVRSDLLRLRSDSDLTHWLRSDSDQCWSTSFCDRKTAKWPSKFLAAADCGRFDVWSCSCWWIYLPGMNLTNSRTIADRIKYLVLDRDTSPALRSIIIHVMQIILAVRNVSDPENSWGQWTTLLMEWVVSVLCEFYVC